MKHFLYILGTPGVGKITVARLLEKELGWRVFWFHDIKNAVTDIVEDRRIPRLMDEVTTPILKYMLAKDENVIYVRPSADRETVEHVRDLVAQYPGYQFRPVRLLASYETLVARVTARKDPYRIQDKAGLDDYMKRGINKIDGELEVDTDELTPEQVAKAVLKGLKL